MVAKIAISVFGGMVVYVDGKLAKLKKNVDQVLLLLVLHHEAGITKDEIIASVWSSSNINAGQYFTNALGDIRALGVTVRENTGVLRLAFDEADVDVIAFEDAVAAALRPRRLDDEARNLECARRIYKGAVAPDATGGLIEGARLRYEREYLNVCRRLVDNYTQSENLEEALSTFHDATRKCREPASYARDFQDMYRCLMDKCIDTGARDVARQARHSFKDIGGFLTVSVEDKYAEFVKPSKAPARSVRGGRRLASMEYVVVLTNVVTEDGPKRDLFVSVGDADFVTPWLFRLLEDARSGLVPEPRIRRLFLKRMNQNLIDQHVRNGELPAAFGETLERNLSLLEESELLRQKDIKVHVYEWDKPPPFHGYLFGDHILIGDWITDPTGYRSHRTGHNHITRMKDRKTYALISEKFLDGLEPGIWDEGVHANAEDTAYDT